LRVEDVPRTAQERAADEREQLGREVVLIQLREQAHQGAAGNMLLPISNTRQKRVLVDVDEFEVDGWPACAN